MKKIIQEIESGLITSNRLVNKATYELQQYNNELEVLKSYKQLHKTMKIKNLYKVKRSLMEKNNNVVSLKRTTAR